MVQESSNELERLFGVYCWWSSILILELMILTWKTGRLRVKHQIIHSEEDRMWMEESNVIMDLSGGGHPDIDHIRSAHINDIKIIIPYLIITPIWLHLSSPTPAVSSSPSPPSYQSPMLYHITLFLFPIAKTIHFILHTIMKSSVLSTPFYITCYTILLFISFHVLILSF